MNNFWEDPFYSSLFLGGYLGVLTFVWCIMVIAVPYWGRRWQVLPPKEDTPQSGSWLSICIPARNEAENIAQCVKSALAVKWPKLEVIVVDDRSTDETGKIALEAAAGDSRLRIVQGSEPQRGWAGKPWACYRAASESRGAWLLFIDADVQIHPDAPRAAIDLASLRDLSLLSFFGRWTLIGFWESALIPTIGWLIRGSIDFDRVNLRSHVGAFANGQFILMRRDSYMAIDGHGCVKDQVLEDVRLAQVVKRSGYGAEVRPAAWAFQVRLYRGLSDIVNGYTKNLYEGMGRNPLVGFGAALFIFLGSLLPFMALGAGLLFHFGFGWEFPQMIWIVWITIICLLQFFFRWQIERFDGRSGWFAFMHPIANILLLWILLRSTLQVKVEWKGRSFVDGKASKRKQ